MELDETVLFKYFYEKVRTAKKFKKNSYHFRLSLRDVAQLMEINDDNRYSIDLHLLWKNILKDGFSLEQVYCIERVCSILGIYKVNDNYNIRKEDDYYEGFDYTVGELNEEDLDEILFKTNEVIKLNDFSDMMRYVLNLEYGYVLNYLKQAKFSIVNKVTLSDIIPGSEEHYNMKIVKDKALNHMYGNNIKFLPVCICKKISDKTTSNTKYKIIDGHHRFSVAKNTLKDTDTVSIILTS